MSRLTDGPSCECCGAPWEGGEVKGPRCHCIDEPGIGRSGLFVHVCPRCGKCARHCACVRNAEVEAECNAIEQAFDDTKIFANPEQILYLASLVSIRVDHIRKATRRDPGETPKATPSPELEFFCRGSDEDLSGLYAKGEHNTDVFLGAVLLYLARERQEMFLEDLLPAIEKKEVKSAWWRDDHYDDGIRYKTMREGEPARTA